MYRLIASVHVSRDGAKTGGEPGEQLLTLSNFPTILRLVLT